MVEWLFIITAVASLVVAVLNLVGANLYDLRAVRRQRQLQRHPYSLQNRQRPLVSVIITAHNDERVIERCLASLVRSAYRKYEILVVDNASSDRTKNLVKQFNLDHPAKPIRLIARRTADDSPKVLVANYKKYGSGELVLWLEAASQLDKQALGNAVKHFNAAPAVGQLRLNRRIGPVLSTVGLFQKYQELLCYRSKKFDSLIHTDYGRSGAGNIYRRTAFLSLQKPARLHSSYASDAIVYAEPPTSFYQLLRQHYQRRLDGLQTLRGQLTWFRLIWTMLNVLVMLAMPLLVSYFIYIAISLREPSLLLVSWAGLGILLLLAIWGDEHTRWRHKAAYSALLPVTYGLFYLLSFVPLLVALRPIKWLMPKGRSFAFRPFPFMIKS